MDKASQNWKFSQTSQNIPAFVEEEGGRRGEKKRREGGGNRRNGGGRRRVGSVRRRRKEGRGGRKGGGREEESLRKIEFGNYPICEKREEGREKGWREEAVEFGNESLKKIKEGRVLGSRNRREEEREHVREEK